MKSHFNIIIWLSVGLLSMSVGFSAAVEDAPAPCAHISIASPTPDEACLAYIESAPRPDFEPIPIDQYTLNVFQYWQAREAGTPLYDAPNGQIIGRTNEGLVYYRVQEASEDGMWVRNEEGQWLQAEDLHLEQVSEFSGVQLGGSEQRPFAWVLQESQPLAYPGAEAAADEAADEAEAAAADEDAPTLARYELVHLFASVTDEAGKRWYMIGADQWLPEEQLAVFRPPVKPRFISRDRWLAVDLSEQILVGFWQDEPQFATLVSSGTEGFDTPMGVYEVWARLEMDSMSGFTGAPDAYGLESVPWVLYYFESIGFHGTYWHDGFGAPLSHGCVNLSVSDSAFVYRWTVDGIGAFGTDGVEEIDTQVYVYRSGLVGNGVASD